MEMLNDLLYNIQDLVRGINLGTVISLVLFSASVAIFIKVFYEYLTYRRNKMKYLIRKGRNSILKDITRELMRIKPLRPTIRKVALKIGMVSRYTYDRNLEIATGLILGAIMVSIIIIFMIVPSENIIWYEIFFYLLIAFILILVVGYLFFAITRTSFIAKLPDVYKILNSRYISKGNILKAIDLSLDDFDKVIKKEMMKIYNILKKNDMTEIELAFKEMELTYETEYLTILLSLIKQAHYKGGNDMIKEQFETITEEILQEIENQRDLTATSRSYIMMGVFVPVVMKVVEWFNEESIGPEAVEFYQSQLGKNLSIGTIICLLLYIGLLLFLERSV